MQIDNDLAKNLELVYSYQKEIFVLQQTLALLGWDERTYMPKKAAESRAEQNAFIEGLIHEKITSEKLYTALETLKKERLENKEALMIEKLHKEVLRARKIPKELVEEIAKIASIAYNSWIKAKEESNFSILAPVLEKIVELKIKKAKCIISSNCLYDNLLDYYEEGMTAEKLRPIFEKLKAGLKELLKRIENSENYKNQKIMPDKILEARPQLELARELAKSMGLSEDNFRIDTTEHPFSTKISSEDVRITTNVRKGVFNSLSSSIHEMGHALYSLNLPKEDAYNILGQEASTGLHESQSRFWENMIGLGRPFWEYFFPKFNSKYNLQGNFEEWYQDINAVFPGKIRIESDEIHYCLHIILRFEIELGLIEGKIKVKDLPKVWNEKMKEIFGYTPKNDREGVLQDVHWSTGEFGYFPTYAIGTIYAAQLYDSIKRDIPNIGGDIFQGNFSRISEWLTKKVHIRGSKLLADDIIKNTCGSGLNPEVFLEYLNKKYSEIYDLEKIKTSN